MKTKIFIPTLLFLIVVTVGVVAIVKPGANSAESVEFTETKTTPGGIVLYYGIGCPFCEKVDAYIEEEGIDGEVTFENKEVYYNRDNASELALVASTCGLPSNNIGVPFLWDGENCFVGMPDIVNFFNEKVTDNKNE